MIVVLTVVARCQEPSPTASISAKRNYMLRLINGVRSTNGLVSLYLDNTLNLIAQGHSVDMVSRKFFDHINPSGQSPQDRAKAVGFNNPVGENIALGSTLTSIHASLMASPLHYANTVNKEWRRAGVGIYYKSDGTIYVTIVFSGRDFDKYPATGSELKAVVAQIDTYIKANNPLVKLK